MENKAYPFRVKKSSRTVVAKINADCYSNALNKVLSLHPGERVKTRFALNIDGYQYPIKVDGTSPIIIKTKPYKLILNTMDLISAKVEAAKESRAQRKKMYIIVDEEEEAIISSLPAKKKGNVTLTAFVNGSEVPLDDFGAVPESEPLETKNKLKTKKSKTMSTEVLTPVKKVKAAKKADKKIVAVKKSAAKPAKKEVVAEVISGTSVLDAVKQFIKSGLKKGLVKVAGKTFGIRKGSTWLLSKSLIEDGKDGVLMIAEGHDGFYNYPASKYKDVFGKVMASETWKNTGSYGQSKFSSTHDEFWTALK